MKPLVKDLIRGKSSTFVVTGPSKSKNNKFLYKLSPPGILTKIYESASQLSEVLKRGGKFAKKDFVLRVRGFNLVGDLKSDIFSLNPMEAESSKLKTLRLESLEDMKEFCKICRNSISVLRAALQRIDVEREVIQCIQFCFDIKDGE